MIFLLVLVPASLYWIYWRWTHRRMLELSALLPGPPALPLIGNGLLFIANPEEQLNKISKLIKKYGQYARVWLGPDLNVCVKNPADIRYLLTSNKVNEKGPVYSYMVPFIGRGILTGGPGWRVYRKTATPSYNKRAVQLFTEIFNADIDELVEVLCKKNPRTTFNVYFDVVKCTTQSVCQTLMGLSKEDTRNIKRLHEVVIDTQSMYELVFSKMTRWWLQIPLVYWLSGKKKLHEYYKKMIDEMMSDILSKKRKANERHVVNEEVMGVVDRFILRGLNEEEIRTESFALFTTSQEAAAKVASAVLLFLAHLPEWQDKVYNEIVDVIGQDEHVTEEHLKQLENLDMVYKEVLRYLPIAAMLQRTVEEEITINNGKITLPVGTSLVIPIHDLHRDPQYWDEPDIVKPERFLPENVKKRDPNVFVPFSLGAMDCLGRVYATMIIKILVVKVVRQLHLEADGRIEDLDLHLAVSVKFAKGYNLRVRKRDG